jgi:signal transduction histidine kinase/ActR/RegA family two-component response regulator
MQVSDAQLPDGPVFERDQFVKSKLWPYYLNACVDAEYRKFIQKQVEQEGNLFLFALCLLWTVPTFLRLSMLYSAGPNNLSLFFSITMFLLVGSVAVIVCHFLSLLVSSAVPVLRWIHNLVVHRYFLRIGILGLNIGNVLNLVARVVNGPCPDVNTEFDCTPQLALPTLHVMSIVMNSFATFFLSKHLTYRLVTVNTAVTCVFMVAAGFLSAAESGDTRFPLAILFSYVIFFVSTHCIAFYDMTSFEYYMQLRELRVAEVKSAKEHAWKERENMRMVLANVAHDLKTPLQAFNAGVHTSRSILADTITASPIVVPRDKAVSGVALNQVSDNRRDFDRRVHVLEDTDDGILALVLPLAKCDTLGAVFREMEASCAFMTMQINRALDVSRNDSSLKLVAKYEPVVIPDLVQWSESIMSCIQNRVRIEVEYRSNFHKRVITDRVWFQENLLCLLSNAVKFSPSDSRVIVSVQVQNMDGTSVALTERSSSTGDRGARLSSDGTSSIQRGRSNSATSTDSHSVATSSVASVSEINPEAFSGMVGGYIVDETKRRLMVEVMDNGIGVPEDRVDCLFKPFSQTQRRAGGTGLGLYSLALRIQALGGSYGMRPNKGQDGSVFYFWIPMYEENVDETFIEILPVNASAIDTSLRMGGSGGEEVIGRKDPVTTSSKDGKRRHEALGGPDPMVLVVDDSPPSLKTVQRALSQSGSVVQTASDGFTALKLMKSTLYTVVIMDIQMPIMDGLESVRQLRAWEKGSEGDGKHQYVIGATACMDDDTRQEALEVGMDEVVGKPFVFSEIISHLHVVHSNV